jgi:hypothetical protein
VEYERFGRHEAPMELKVHLAPGVARDGKACIWFSRDYIEALAIEQVSPEQTEMKVHPDRHVLEFVLPSRSEQPRLSSKRGRKKSVQCKAVSGLKTGRVCPSAFHLPVNSGGDSWIPSYVPPPSTSFCS